MYSFCEIPMLMINHQANPGFWSEQNIPAGRCLWACAPQRQLRSSQKWPRPATTTQVLEKTLIFPKQCAAQFSVRSVRLVGVFHTMVTQNEII